jgi:hypothetical protein
MLMTKAAGTFIQAQPAQPTSRLTSGGIGFPNPLQQQLGNTYSMLMTKAAGTFIQAQPAQPTSRLTSGGIWFPTLLQQQLGSTYSMLMTKAAGTFIQAQPSLSGGTGFQTLLQQCKTAAATVLAVGCLIVGAAAAALGPSRLAAT